jgi:uncharacterized protein YjiS (DUF1127 family)
MFSSIVRTTRLARNQPIVRRPFKRLMRLWWRNAWSRSHLRDLDDHLLRDVGLTRKQAERESLKWFWQ